MFLQSEYFSVFVEIMHFLAKLANGIASVFFFVCTVNGREYFSHRCVFVNQFFKANQLGNKVVHLRFVFCRCHEEKNVVQIAFFRNDSVFTEIIGENVAGNAEFFVIIVFNINTAGDEL